LRASSITHAMRSSCSPRFSPAIPYPTRPIVPRFMAASHLSRLVWPHGRPIALHDQRYRDSSTINKTKSNGNHCRINDSRMFITKGARADARDGLKQT
jgi:hypothetical protein